MADIKVILFDLQQLTEGGFAHIVGQAKGIKLVRSVRNKKEAVQALKKYKADVFVIDPLLPEAFSLTELSEIREQYPKLEILIITGNLDKEFVDLVTEMGFNGFLTKMCEEDEVIRAIQSLSVHSRFYCNKVLDVILDRESSYSEGPSSISSREKEIVILIAKGFSTQEIAQELHLSHHTINTHRKNILKKLSAKSAVDLVLYAINEGWVTPDGKND